eukprot:COSAG05_NODE_13_length_36464_cov_294.169449_27_plen_102_part_00
MDAQGGGGGGGEGGGGGGGGGGRGRGSEQLAYTAPTWRAVRLSCFASFFSIWRLYLHPPQVLLTLGRVRRNYMLPAKQVDQHGETGGRYWALTCSDARQFL